MDESAKSSEPARTWADIVAGAEAFMRANHDVDLTLAEVANAVSASVRTLQVAFRAERGRTPWTVLRVIRLCEARRELLDSTIGTTVTQAALAHGHTHFGRFSVDYRRQFGESPSRTLERVCGRKRADHARAPRTMVNGQTRRGVGEAPDIPSDAQKKQARSQVLAMLALEPSAVDACARLFDHLHSSLAYARGAIVLKRRGDSRPLVFSHCGACGGIASSLAETSRANAALETGNCFVNAVLKEGMEKTVGRLDGELDYVAMDSSIQSETCHPILWAGDVIGAINFESDREEAFAAVDCRLVAHLAGALAPVLASERARDRHGYSDLNLLSA